jgi:SPP1 gp7 family putative phage head morphogenesis protein
MPAPIGGQAEGVMQEVQRVAVDLDITETKTRLDTEAIRLIKRLVTEGQEGDTLAELVFDGLMDLSDQPIRRASRGAASEAYNLGRNVVIQSREGEIVEVVRSEVLDRNTCPPCHDLDGRVFRVDSPEYLENMPPAGCDGREYCRGFYIPRRRAA